MNILKQNGLHNLFLFVACGVLVSCSDTTNRGLPFDEQGGRATAEGTTITLENRGDEKIYYYTISRSADTYTFWIPSLNEDYSVEPGERTSYEYESKSAEEHRPDEEEVNVYYWHAVETPEGERKPGEIYVQVVEIEY